jgi:5-methyltetrahydrofolate--homocysteine methyltransferase
MTFLEFLERRQTLLLDGATGTELMARGFKSGDSLERWNVDEPGKVADVARSYFEAGSDAVLTNTFGGSVIKLQAFQLENQAYELNLAGCRNALAARPDGRFVIGSIGPTGKFMPPLGPVEEPEMIGAFTPQVKAMHDAGVDAVMVETFTDINELACAVKAVKENSDLPFICSLTFDKTPKGYRTIMGASVKEAAEHLLEGGAAVVGSNCGHGLLNMIEILAEYRDVSSDLKILGKPNAGIPEYRSGGTFYTEGEGFFKDHIASMLDLSPAIIGGCCGTHPGHIRVMREAIDRRKGTRNEVRGSRNKGS